jgi:hypothetical protein
VAGSLVESSASSNICLTFLGLKGERLPLIGFRSPCYVYCCYFFIGSHVSGYVLDLGATCHPTAIKGCSVLKLFPSLAVLNGEWQFSFNTAVYKVIKINYLYNINYILLNIYITYITNNLEEVLRNYKYI